MLLIPALLVIQFILIAVWSRVRTAPALRIMLGGLVVAPLLVLLQALVVTDRERIDALCHDLAHAAEVVDLECFGDCIAVDFDAAGMNKAELLRRLEHAFTRAHVEEVKLRDMTITVDGGRGTATFNASCRFISPSRMIARMRSRWELVVVSRDGTWRVQSIKPSPMPFFPFHSMDEVLRAAR